MKHTYLMQSNALVAGLLLCGLAIGATQQSTPVTGTKSESEQTAKTNVTAHSHPRDAKGLMVPEKSSPKEDKNEPVASEPKKETSSSGVTPHNHMRDAKGIYIAPKKPKTSTDVKSDKQEKTESGSGK